MVVKQLCFLEKFNLLCIPRVFAAVGMDLLLVGNKHAEFLREVDHVIHKQYRCVMLQIPQDMLAIMLLALGYSL